MSDPNGLSTQVVACRAGYGEGGLGQRLAEVVERARSAGALIRYYSERPRPHDSSGVQVRVRWVKWIGKSVLRWAPGWLSFFDYDAFDRTVSRHLGQADIFTGFGGQALHCFQAARRLRYRKLVLVAANSHVSNVLRQHQRAYRRYPFEKSWLNIAQARKTIREYSAADVVLAASRYTRDSLIAEGVPSTKIELIETTVKPNFSARQSQPSKHTFCIVFIGSLSVVKGVPVLIEAFGRLRDLPAELLLVGNSGSRGMRRFLKRACLSDPRIRIVPGDPRPHLERAHVCVHPTWEDGFGRAPLEAMRCGVPVIVTEDTGMKELVREGIDGYIVPTGDVDALCERMDQIRKKSC